MPSEDVPSASASAWRSAIASSEPRRTRRAIRRPVARMPVASVQTSTGTPIESRRTPQRSRRRSDGRTSAARPEIAAEPAGSGSSTAMRRDSGADAPRIPSLHAANACSTASSRRTSPSGGVAARPSPARNDRRSQIAGCCSTTPSPARSSRGASAGETRMVRSSSVARPDSSGSPRKRRVIATRPPVTGRPNALGSSSRRSSTASSAV